MLVAMKFRELLWIFQDLVIPHVAPGLPLWPLHSNPACLLDPVHVLSNALDSGMWCCLSDQVYSWEEVMNGSWCESNKDSILVHNLASWGWQDWGDFLLALISNICVSSSSRCQDQCFSQSIKVTHRWQHPRKSRICILSLSCLNKSDFCILKHIIILS